jgi:hypothetical protein
VATLTNKYGMPGPVVQAVERDPYTHGKADISTTTLIAPPRIRQLRRRYDEFITEDVTDRIWSLVGQVGHAILERAAGKRHAGEVIERIAAVLGSSEGGPRTKLAQIEGAVKRFLAPEDGLIIERRFYMERQGWVISGQMDLLRSDASERWGINDYKFTSVWSVIRGGKEEWASQLNVYAHLARENGIDPRDLTIIPIFRDWKKGDMRKARLTGDNYPDKQIIRFPIEMWSPERTEEYILERLQMHQDAERQRTGSLPFCTDKDRWLYGTTWAIKKKGGKRALSGSVSDTFEAAKEFLESLGDEKKGDHYIEKREGTPIRCIDYCNAAPFCTQHQEWEAANTSNN